MPTYIIRVGEDGPVKIGRADNVEKRLEVLQQANHERLRVIRIIDTPFDSEPVFHARFARRQLHGEWFEFDEEMMSFVPSGPLRQGTRDMMKSVSAAARDEARDLMHEAYKAFRAVESRASFYVRAGRILGLSKRRVRAIFHLEARRIEVHEIVGLRDFARRLRREQEPAQDLARATKPDDLFKDC